MPASAGAIRTCWARRCGQASAPNAIPAKAGPRIAKRGGREFAPHSPFPTLPLSPGLSGGPQLAAWRWGCDTRRMKPANRMDEVPRTSRGMMVFEGDKWCLIRPLSFTRTIADGFRDGRHELSPLCPGACGACPRSFREGARKGSGQVSACGMPRASPTFHIDTPVSGGIPHSSYRSRASARGGFLAVSNDKRIFPGSAQRYPGSTIGEIQRGDGTVDPGSAACLRRLKPAPAYAGVREKS